MATYRDIQKSVKDIGGFVPKTCWIAHVKSELGLPLRRAWNRESEAARQVPCPLEKKRTIIKAMQQLGIVWA
jgi:hypothetical protein